MVRTDATVIDSAGDAWTGRAGFIAAAIGSAVGLGNIWRFAYVAGENGGAAFLLVYAVIVVLIGLPVLLSEFVLGTRSRGDILAAFSAPGAGRWRWVGVVATLVAFLILSYYSVIAGWACRYFWAYASGTLAALPQEALPAEFERFASDPRQTVGWHALFIALAAFVVSAGVAGGIERASRLLMPLLGVIIIVLAAYAVSLPGAGGGLVFLFSPDWSALRHPQLYLAALGQAFFSLGVGIGVMVVYASYAGNDGRHASVAAAVAAGDTLFAVVAGMAVFPIVFAFGLDPAYGPALAFVTLPQVFAVMPGGWWVATAFFFLLSAAALTSAVSLLEVPVALLARRGVSRPWAALGVAALAFVVGVPSALGTGPWRELTIAGLQILDAIDFVSANLLLPVVGLAVVIYVGWRLPAQQAISASGLPHALGCAWLLVVRYVAPLAMAVFLLTPALV